MAGIDRLRAARARSRQEFCLAYGGTREADDPFSALLIHDGRVEQPWSRIDVKRNIVSLADHEGDFIALSDEGEAPREKIPGAGIYSEDATGKGAMQALGIINGRLAACGLGGQVYSRAADGVWISMGASIPVEEGFKEIVLRTIVEDGTDVVLCGYAEPHNIGMTKETQDAILVQDLQRYEQLMRALPPARVLEGRAYRLEGTRWQRLSLPMEAVLHDAFISGTDSIWMIGTEGTILAKSAGGSFEKLGFHGDNETLISGTSFGDRHVIASDFALHLFDGHRLTQLAPPLGKATAAPLMVQAVDGILYYFDTKRGVHRYDEANWEEIRIPPQLPVGGFKGLSPPRR